MHSAVPKASAARYRQESVMGDKVGITESVFHQARVIAAGRIRATKHLKPKCGNELQALGHLFVCERERHDSKKHQATIRGQGEDAGVSAILRW